MAADTSKFEQRAFDFGEKETNPEAESARSRFVQRSRRWSSFDDIHNLREEAKNCDRCGLRENCRQVVFGEGACPATIMLVGEAPGRDEDEQGRPFVGRAGRLLDRILAAVDVQRESVFITNAVLCRPPSNRTPTVSEMNTCYSLLAAQIRLVEPKILVALGSTATRTLVDMQASVTRLRGQWIEGEDFDILPTFHPAALLRDKRKKKPVWLDFKKIRRRYDRLTS